MPRVHRTAAILSIGDELTLGQTLDTNSRWLSARLVELGILPIEHATVPDDRAATTAAIVRLASRADIVVISGGLGPTADDLTRAALADAMGEPLIEDPAALESIRGWFARAGRALLEINRVQALRPASGECLPNPNGTAPGLAAKINGTLVVALPGPPREMTPMFDAHVVPRLNLAPDRAVCTRALRVFGLGESNIASRLGALMDRDRNPLVGTTASGGVVTCRVREARATDAPSRLDETMSLIRERLGAYVFAEGEMTLAGATLDLLAERRETLAIAESCTGGLLGSMLAATPGASRALVGGWITYSNAMKAGVLGVPQAVLDHAGAVSPECARAMADGALQRSGAEHALAITGIAGPDGGSPNKPVGTVHVARASREGSTEARRFLFAGGRDAVREWSAMSALGMLRLHLVGAGAMPLLRQQS